MSNNRRIIYDLQKTIRSIENEIKKDRDELYKKCPHKWVPDRSYNVMIEHRLFVKFVIWIVEIYIFFLGIMSKDIRKDILNRINNIDVNDLESIQFYQSESELKYEDFKHLENFIETRFFEDNSSNNISNENIASILKISYNEMF